MKAWALQDAKARFSELVKTALADGPQTVTVHGKSTVVVISKKQFDKLTTPKISLYEFLQKSPLRGIDLKIKRDQSLTRDSDL